MKNKILSTVILSVAATSLSEAAITAYSSDFSATSGANSIEGWVSDGTTPTHVFRSTVTADGAAAGDLVAGDGALALDTINSTPGDERITYTVAGSLDLGETITLDYSVFNANVSYSSGTIELYNVTDGVVIVSGNAAVGASTPVVDRTISFTADASQVGDQISIRIAETSDSTARDLFIDTMSLSSVPEPGSTSLLGLGGLALILRRRK